MHGELMKGSVVLLCVWVIFLALGEANDAARRQQIAKERAELPKIRRFIKDHTEEWQANWTDSANRPVFKLTQKQAEVWRKLGEFEEGDEDENDDSKRRKKRAGPLIQKPKKVRTEWRHMRTQHKQGFIDAFHNIATFFPDPSDPNTSLFDIFVEYHQFSNAPSAHGGAAFLCWHREFLWRFLNALRIYGGYKKRDLPYWESSMDQFLPEPRDSALFIEDVQGIGRAVGVLGAPFTSAVVAQIPSCFGGADVTRNARTAPTSQNFLYTRGKYQDIMDKACFDELTLWIDGDMEQFHNTGHVFVGGTMANAACSPGDPMFWLHHANVDCLWEEFRQTQQATSTRSLQYPLNNFGGSGHAWNAPMEPFDDWGLMNVHGLSNHYGNYYYSCKERPSDINCNSDSDCTPNNVEREMLFCDTSLGFCVAKIRQGGECRSGTWPNSQCYCINENATPQCNNNNVCQCN